MTEPETTTAPNEAAATVVELVTKKAKSKKTSAKRITATASKRTEKAAPTTDEQKRLARNAALRDWRKKNRDRYAEYMRTWRENRTKQSARLSHSKKAAAKKGAAHE